MNSDDEDEEPDSHVFSLKVRNIDSIQSNKRKSYNALLTSGVFIMQNTLSVVDGEKYEEWKCSLKKKRRKMGKENALKTSMSMT